MNRNINQINKSEKVSENTIKLCNFVYDKFISGELDNDSLIELIKLSGSFLNLKTIASYSKSKGKDYNIIKRSRAFRKEVLFGVKFIIDNN